MIRKFIKKLFGKSEPPAPAAKPEAHKPPAPHGGGGQPPKAAPREEGGARREGHRRSRRRGSRGEGRPREREEGAPAASGARPEGGHGKGAPTPGAGVRDAGKARGAAPAGVARGEGAERRSGRRRSRGRRGKGAERSQGGGEGAARVAEEAARKEARPGGSHGVAREGRPRESRPERPRRGRSETPPAGPVVWPELPPIASWTPPGDTSSFSAYELPETVRLGINAAGFTTCTPIQAKTLPLSLQGFDVAAQSQTGTGKTAAFLITTFSRLLWRGPVSHPGPRALVIAPTRELTVQIENDARSLGQFTGLSIAVAFGGVDYDKQRRDLQAGPDLLIGTPGRLIDFLKQGVWRPEGVEILIIDEADRMFDMGFIKDLRFILKRLPPYERRQSMLFSATLSWRVMELTYEYMNLPKEIMAASTERLTAEKAEEVLYHVPRTEKPALFLGLLKSEPWTRAIVFTNMKIEAEKVERLLTLHGHHARAITGNLEQAKRLQLMEQFKSGDLPILVATDVASRGLHIEGVSHVFNWDLPQDPEDYVHRIGRTARAGAAGKAITLADEHTVLHLEDIEKLIGYKIPVIWHETEHLAEVKPGWERGPRDERERPGRPGGGRGRRGPGGGRPGGSHGGRPRR